MNWSWNLGKLAGIKVHVHFTMLALLGWIILQHWIAGHDAPKMLMGIVFTTAVFVCILLHEYGHALMARKYGIATKDITLLPIGGLARLERMPELPRQEMAVAIAGPMVNVAIAGVLFGVSWLVGALKPVAELGVASGPFLERLMVTNLFLAAFNMIPALPMDGGRVLRAALAERMPRVRATKIASTVAQGIAVLFAFAGVFVNPWLLLIALFVWMGAAQESAESETKSVLRGIPVEHAMMTDFRSLEVLDTPERAVAAMISGSQKDFPVVHGDRFVGVLVQHDLLRALSSGDQLVHMGQVMRRECVTLSADEVLGDVFGKVMISDQGCFPVLREGRLVGLLTIENVLEFVAFRRAIQTRELQAA